MSDSSTPAAACVQVPIDSLMSLAEKLKQTAEALLDLSGSEVEIVAEPETGPPPESCEPTTGQNDELPATDPAPGEYRHYHLPLSCAREEKELLARCGGESFADALSHIQAELYVTAFLMKGYDGYDDLDSFHVHLIGEHLERSLDKLGMACSVMADYRLVQALPAPAP